MKTIKTLFTIVVLSTFFIACEADATNDEIGIENIDVIGEDEEQETNPSLNKFEDEEQETNPSLNKFEDEEQETNPSLKKMEDEEQETNPTLN